MKITKADLTEAVFKKHDTMTRQDAAGAVEAILRISKQTLISGSDLLLTNFGKFSVKEKNPRRGRNPHTGESLTLDARRVVTFSPAGALREKVNGK